MSLIRVNKNSKEFIYNKESDDKYTISGHSRILESEFVVYFHEIKQALGCDRATIDDLEKIIPQYIHVNGFCYGLKLTKSHTYERLKSIQQTNMRDYFGLLIKEKKESAIAKVIKKLLSK